jgi:hypothetical protein
LGMPTLSDVFTICSSCSEDGVTSTAMVMDSP